MLGSARAIPTSSASFLESPTKSTPRSAPLVRRMRTSARVSIPRRPIVPARASHSPSAAPARWLLGSSAASRTTNPFTATEALSTSSSAMP